jgi:hypothetical protein
LLGDNSLSENGYMTAMIGEQAWSAQSNSKLAKLISGSFRACTHVRAALRNDVTVPRQRAKKKGENAQREPEIGTKFPNQRKTISQQVM